MSSEDHEPVTVPHARGMFRTKAGVLAVDVGEEGTTRKRVFVGDDLIDDDSEVFEPGGEGELVIPRWLAEREGLPYVEHK